MKQRSSGEQPSNNIQANREPPTTAAWKNIVNTSKMSNSFNNKMQLIVPENCIPIVCTIVDGFQICVQFQDDEPEPGTRCIFFKKYRRHSRVIYKQTDVCPIYVIFLVPIQSIFFNFHIKSSWDFEWPFLQKHSRRPPSIFALIVHFSLVGSQVLQECQNVLKHLFAIYRYASADLGVAVDLKHTWHENDNQRLSCFHLCLVDRLFLGYDYCSLFTKCYKTMRQGYERQTLNPKLEITCHTAFFDKCSNYSPSQDMTLFASVWQEQVWPLRQYLAYRRSE